MEITIATELTDELVEAFNRLVPQLSSSSLPPTRAELNEMVTSPSNSVFIARDPGPGTESGGRIVGTLTLVTFRIPTGVRAWIEDVVVENAVRGKGIGEALTRAALERAAELGARTVDLTSRPSREAANRLYQRVGFQLRETNLYRYNLK
jgi:ribosomal protein S18 acetylase RimI-like enzyme